MKAGLVLIATLASALCAAPTFADEPLPPVGAAEVRGDLLSYYRGERTAAFVVTGLGVAGIATGTVLVTRSSDFARGLGWPLLTLGALEILGGVSYAIQVNGEIDHYGDLLAKDPARYRADEIEHLAGTQRRFVFYRLGELALTLVGAGIATYGFAAKKPLYQGIGIGCFAVGAPFLVIDTYNNGRAAWYADQVQHFRTNLAVGPIEGGGFRVSLGGTL